MSFTVDAKYFLQNAERAFTAGLKKGLKEANVKKLTPDQFVELSLRIGRGTPCLVGARHARLGGRRLASERLRALSLVYLRRQGRIVGDWLRSCRGPSAGRQQGV